ADVHCRGNLNASADDGCAESLKRKEHDMTDKNAGTTAHIGRLQSARTHTTGRQVWRFLARSRRKNRRAWRGGVDAPITPRQRDVNEYGRAAGWVCSVKCWGGSND